nr:hypothetical protein [Tanacetum cinerariifolium]
RLVGLPEDEIHLWPGVDVQVRACVIEHRKDVIAPGDFVEVHDVGQARISPASGPNPDHCRRVRCKQSTAR